MKKIIYLFFIFLVIPACLYVALDREKININDCLVSKKPAPEGWEEVVKLAMDKIK